MGIDRNEIDDQLARQGSSHQLTGPEPALGISARVARGVIWDWMSRKHEEYWQSIHGQRQAKCFLKRPSAKIFCRITQLEQKPARHNDNVVNRTLSNSPKCDRHKHAPEMASHIICGCEALATLRFRPMGQFL
jgi:hypothetical protein